jgi:hypothetical protein
LSIQKEIHLKNWMTKGVAMAALALGLLSAPSKAQPLILREGKRISSTAVLDQDFVIAFPQGGLE